MAASCSILDVHNGSAGGPVPRLAGFSCLFRPYSGRVGRTVPVSREHDTAMADTLSAMKRLAKMHKEMYLA